MFVTIFAAILNVRPGELVYTNAGHNPPYIKGSGGRLKRLDKRHGPVVGALDGIVYTEDRLFMEPGEMLFLYTDGVTEAMNTKNKLFSEDRLRTKLALKSVKDPQTSVTKIMQAVNSFSGEAEQADDVTILALSYHGSQEREPVAQEKITIKNELPEIEVVNQRFSAFAKEFDIPQSVVARFNVIFDDLLNNVISYAYRDDDEHSIEVELGLWADRLVVRISDDGVPFNPLRVKSPDTTGSLEERKTGGVGLHLVRSLVDDLSYQRRIGKNVMTLTRSLATGDTLH